MTVLYEAASPHPGGYRDVDPARVVGAGDKVRVIDVREPAVPARGPVARRPSSLRRAFATS